MLKIKFVLKLIRFLLYFVNNLDNNVFSIPARSSKDTDLQPVPVYPLMTCKAILLPQKSTVSPLNICKVKGRILTTLEHNQ